jgi:hypothetical protein
MFNATQRIVFSNCSLKRIRIPRNVKVLCKSCFQECRQLETVTFEKELQLTQINESCFANCSLKSIEIPRKVKLIDKTTFSDCKCVFISVDPDNSHFSVDRDFLMSKDGAHLVRYFGRSNQVHIWRDIQVLDELCFLGCDLVGMSHLILIHI